MYFLLILFLASDLASVKTEPNLERRSERALDNAGAAFDAARDAYNGGDLAKAKVQLEEVRDSVDLANRSLEESGKDARRNPKFYIRAEVKTRALLRRLDGMVLAVSVEDRDLVEKVRDRVAEVHDGLLKSIMSKKK